MNTFRVALTFDTEHPDQPQCKPVFQDGILDTLANEDVRATFFVQGRWATAYPDILRRIAKEHTIGNHSHFHADMRFLTNEGIINDITLARNAIKEICAKDPWPLFRLPFGYGIDDPRVIGLLAQGEWRNVHWNVDPQDWSPTNEAGGIEQRVVEQVLAKRDKSIVLLHSWPEPTPAALPKIIRRLRENGASFVTMDTLL